jgi:murein DD-endopeptidase MepM/ murein hydrolase activator NlpD
LGKAVKKGRSMFRKAFVTSVIFSVLIAGARAQSETAFTKLADGFDFPVGKAEAQGYYKARGFRPNGHLGEDWDGVGGGDTDLNDPVSSIGGGVVVFARDVHLGWGNVVIVRHSFREDGVVKTIDALYGHLNTILVARGQNVARGQQIGTIGTAHGRYDAHLHFEIRKNLEIGINRAAFSRDFSNYYDPTRFIIAHRHLATGFGKYPVAMNTFARDGAYNFDNAPNFGSRPRSSSAHSKSSVVFRVDRFSDLKN